MGPILQLRIFLFKCIFKRLEYVWQLFPLFLYRNTIFFFKISILSNTVHEKTFFDPENRLSIFVPFQWLVAMTSSYWWRRMAAIWPILQTFNKFLRKNYKIFLGTWASLETGYAIIAHWCFSEWILCIEHTH